MKTKKELKEQSYNDFEVYNSVILDKIQDELSENFEIDRKSLIINITEYIVDIKKLKKYLKYKGYSCDVIEGRHPLDKKDVVLLKMKF